MSVPLTTSLLPFFLRDLQTLRLELEAFEDDEQMWILPEGLPNSAGTLALHLVGNLQHFIGHKLGHTDYKRDRMGEFSRTGLSRQYLIDQISTTAAVLEKVLPTLSDEQLNALFPDPIGPDNHISVRDLLLQLVVHLGYHLGQVSYHRRLVTGNPAGVGAQSPLALHSATRKNATD